MSRSLKRRVFLVTWVVALALAASVPALAVVRGTVWIGPRSFTSASPLRHPLLAIGSDVYLPRGSRAMVISIGGQVHIGGIVGDDIAGLSAPIYLNSGARVRRDVVSVGDSVYRAPHVQVDGRVGSQMVSWSGSGTPGGGNLLAETWHYSRLSFAVGLALLLICTCIAVTLPWQTVLVANNVHRDLLRSAVAGLMGVFLFAFLAVPLGLSLFGLPFALLLAVAASAAWLVGLTGAAVTLGRYLARLRRHEAGLLWAVVSGMFVGAFVIAIPWVGPIIVGLAGVTGAGSLALAMIGRARPEELPEELNVSTDETIGRVIPYIPSGGRP